MYQIDVTTDRISTGIRPDFMGGLPARNRFKAIQASAAERRILEFHKNACRMQNRPYYSSDYVSTLTQHTCLILSDGPEAHAASDSNIFDPECMIANS